MTSPTSPRHPSSCGSCRGFFTTCRSPSHIAQGSSSSYSSPLPHSRRALAGRANQTHSPAAVALLAILSIDILLDARSIVHAHDPWPGWALILRLIMGVSLIAIFWVYIAIGDVFAPGFTYWGMSDNHGRVLAYMFLWGIGLWNLLFVILCRHWLGKEVKRYGTRARGIARERRSPGVTAHRLGSAGGEGPNRIVVVDVEAARPTTENERGSGGGGGGGGGGRVGLPVRMGVRRLKNNLSVSIHSVASGTRPGTGTGVGASPPPPPAVMRPA